MDVARQMEPNDVMDVRGLCRYLKISERKVRGLVSDNELPYFKIGKSVRFHKYSVDKWLKVRKNTKSIRFDDVIDSVEASKFTPHQEKYHIYLLLYKGVVVYVGQSRNVHSRVKDHQASKKFDDFKTLETSKELVFKLESILISAFAPKYNIISEPKELSEKDLVLLRDIGLTGFISKSIRPHLNAHRETPFGYVEITHGLHKGQVGYYDDDEEDGDGDTMAVVYVEDDWIYVRPEWIRPTEKKLTTQINF